MIIDKVLNNNAVVCQDDKNGEIIVTGKGIAFNKKHGDCIEMNLTTKIFTLPNQEMTKKFQLLVEEIPIEVMDISETIISYAKKHSNKKINDTIYITLTDHIYSVKERYKKGIKLRNEIFWEVKRLYKEEMKIGEKAVELISEAFHIELLKDEAAFIAIHFVNAEMESCEKNDVVSMTKVMQDILNVVKYYFKIEFDENSLSYDRFITHLKFFAQRLILKKVYTDDDTELFDVTKAKYKEAYSCVKKIALLLKEQYEYEISKEEQLYLLIHIERVTRSIR